MAWAIHAARETGRHDNQVKLREFYNLNILEMALRALPNAFCGVSIYLEASDARSKNLQFDDGFIQIGWGSEVTAQITTSCRYLHGEEDLFLAYHNFSCWVEEVSRDLADSDSEFLLHNYSDTTISKAGFAPGDWDKLPSLETEKGIAISDIFN